MQSRRRDFVFVTSPRMSSPGSGSFAKNQTIYLFINNLVAATQGGDGFGPRLAYGTGVALDEPGIAEDHD